MAGERASPLSSFTASFRHVRPQEKQRCSQQGDNDRPGNLRYRMSQPAGKQGDHVMEMARGSSAPFCGSASCDVPILDLCLLFFTFWCSDRGEAADMLGIKVKTDL